MSFCVYFNVVSGLNMMKVQRSLEDIFGLCVNNDQMYRFKRYIAASYVSLDNELLAAIVKSPVIHIDDFTSAVPRHYGDSRHAEGDRPCALCKRGYAAEGRSAMPAP